MLAVSEVCDRLFQSSVILNGSSAIDGEAKQQETLGMTQIINVGMLSVHIDKIRLTFFVGRGARSLG